MAAPDTQPAVAPVQALDPRVLRVLLASDDPLTREALGSASRAPGIELLAAANVRNVSEQLAAEHQADVVVLDAQVPALQALVALHRVHVQAPRTRILVFSVPESTEFGLLCLTLGASGYLSKDIDLARLPHVLRRLGCGEAVVSRGLATEAIERLRASERRGQPRATAPISRPERQVLELVQSGCDITEAATVLGVTPATVRRHLVSARRKLASDLPPGAFERHPRPLSSARGSLA